MPDKPLNIGFNVPFFEAIAQAAKRGAVLPDIYYGQLQGIARQKAFSIAGITALDQLQAVKDSLDKAITQGRSFNQWKKEQAVVDLGLPKHRLDNIYRTNLQTAYMAGKWEKFKQNANSRPYLMYDAINDSRVRPSHLALDGIIRPVGDAFWATHSPPRGFRCRCSLISLDYKQAKARSVNGKGLNQQPILGNGQMAMPDKGWDYDKTNRMAGVEKAIAERKIAAGSNWFKKTLLEQMEKKIAQNAKVVESEVEKAIEQKTTMIDKQAFADFVEKVTAENYKARHEFMRVGTLPDFVMADSAVKALEPVNNEIHISDHQLRHALREVKTGKGTALPIDITKNLPEKIESARWFYDSKFNNLLAVFDIEKDGFVGKSALAINFKKRKESLNTIVTSGMIEEKILGMDIYREILNTP